MWPTAWKYAKGVLPNVAEVVVKSAKENPKTALFSTGAGITWLSPEVAGFIGRVLRRLADLVESLPGVL
ncbi:hypothetical protein CMI47_12310 [Candidatus Pacearchaeota archaeon]|mgnify:CR=1 FL=1|jgi:hypothetical protein|nr:hypothetical protein [Candidatus Pacearchaeota archaeon]|tara:strand:+ start:419 stop:625 length:207 start_codon:yes stop_codon:yes gene_type:complete